MCRGARIWQIPIGGARSERTGTVNIRLMQLAAAALLACSLTARTATARGPLPDPAATPGARNARVSQANIGETVCVRGWARTVRPPRRYTDRLKRRLISRAGLPHSSIREFELDHLIPLELGGSPTDPRNLWIEPRLGDWNASLKDDLERRLNRLVCRRKITLD